MLRCKPLKWAQLFLFSTATQFVSAQVIRDTLVTDYGKQDSVTFQSDSRVWLNARSSLDYPTNRAWKKNVLDLQGEAYFELSGVEAPMDIRVGDVDIHASGPAVFNVSGYDEDNMIIITAIKEKIKLVHDKTTYPLKHGEQAVIIRSTVTISTNRDYRDVPDWKNGYFVFNNTPLRIIMRQIERWYNVSVEYADSLDQSPDRRFTGKMSRNVPIENVLKLLQLTGEINFKVEGKKITVSK